MKTRTWYVVLLAVLVLCAAVLSSCESTDALAPDGSELTVSASPSEVIIDLEAGEDRAQAIIEARIFDGAFPLEGVAVTFESDGGSLASSDNSCGSTDQCLRTGGACASDSDCPAVVPDSIETDSNGVARDTLTLTLVDPVTVEVTARSGAKSASVDVSKVVSSGDQPPVAAITADPPDEQRSGQPVIFDGSDSADPDGIITCYQWAVENSVVKEGPAQRDLQYTFTFPLAQLPREVTVELRVSDDTEVGTRCNGNADGSFLPEADFRDVETLRYSVVCDTSVPDLTVPGTQSVAASSGDTEVDVLLQGTATDPESQIRTGSEEWDCGNGSGFVAGLSRTCTYGSNGAKTATFRAANNCGDVATKSVTINVSGLP